MRMTFYTANCRGNAKNSLYPNKRIIDNESLQRQKDSLSRILNGNLAKTEEVRRLLKLVAKAEMTSDFDGELFEEYVDRVVVYSRTEIGFELKCGLTLKERLVR